MKKTSKAFHIRDPNFMVLIFLQDSKRRMPWIARTSRCPLNPRLKQAAFYEIERPLKLYWLREAELHP
jgi:hypothetical protein